MQKSTFKIATKFSDDPLWKSRIPLEYTEVEGYVIGNWGITNWGIDGNPNAGGGDYWVIYHTIKGLRLDCVYYTWENAQKILKITIKMFGENHDGDLSDEDYKKSYEWERESNQLAARECLYFDDDDDDSDD